MQRDHQRDSGYREGAAPLLTALFIDYDNIYLSLKRTSDDAAARFAKDASGWLKAIETGELITPSQGGRDAIRRRLVMNRCYGNPVVRKNSRDNSTDSNSFAFVRHNFLRAGFEVIDCPPLTAQLKNSSDIRMVMDVRDFLTHETYFDEFIILSGDADFTPVLHRLRAHARRTVIFASENTAAPYKAISDGEIREGNLIGFLLGHKATDWHDTGAAHGASPNAAMPAAPLSAAEQYASAYASANGVPGPAAAAVAPPVAVMDFERVRRDIIDIIRSTVQDSPEPVAIELLADRAQRLLGHDNTVGTQWAGAGSFRAFLGQHLPQHLRISDQAPFRVHSVGLGTAIEALSRQPLGEERKPTQSPNLAQSPNLVRPHTDDERTGGAIALAQSQPQTPMQPAMASAIAASDSGPGRAPRSAPASQAPARNPAIVADPPVQPPRRATLQEQPVGRIEQAIARIHQACQAPPLSPPDYRILFDALANELTANGLQGTSTIQNVAARARALGFDAKPDDIRLVLDVVREADPWFENGASAAILASRFRNYVVSRCRAKGLSLAVDEIDLIDAWFAASPPVQRSGAATVATAGPILIAENAPPALASAGGKGNSDQWWSADDSGDEFAAMPRIVRSRVQG